MSTNTNKLAGKIALVTGGSRSIGAAIARRLAADGAAVAITYSTSPDKAAEVVRAIEAEGGRAMAIQAVISVAIIALSWRAVAGAPGSMGHTATSDPAIRAFVVASATPLALPYAFNYDLPCTAIIMVWMLAGRITLRPSLRLALLFAWLAPFLSMMNGTLHQLAVTPAALTWLFALSLTMAAQASAACHDSARTTCRDGSVPEAGGAVVPAVAAG